MRKLIITALCLLLAGGSYTAIAQEKQGAAQQKTGPRFKFESGETHDFGVIQRGPVAMHTFEFTNVGTQPLIIMNVTPSCGCTHVDWDKKPILPGQKGHISLGLITAEQKGVFKKEIYIQSNALIPNGDRRYCIFFKGNAVTSVEKKK
jgi:hypothetical protein